MPKLKIKEIKCKSALSKCGFSEGSFCVNPYVGCGHACQYCYARFMKRFVGHSEPWGSFVDVRVNIAEVLKRQIQSSKYKNKLIYIGTVTDPYQSLERKYKLTRKILEILLKYQNPVEILTKSNLILRDIDLLKKFEDIQVNFTINTLDEKWKKLVEPYSSSIKERLEAAKKLSEQARLPARQGIEVAAMMGPYWPFFTDPEKLLKEFNKAGVSFVFTESFNMTGSNWAGVDRILKKYYAQFLPKIREIMLNKNNFNKFYSKAEKKIKYLSKKYKLPINIWFKK